MLKNKPIYIFAVILIAIVTIAISVVVSVYNKNKPIIPDKDIAVLSSNDMLKIKNAYESQNKKDEFLSLCQTIELATANKFLDGSVTNDEQLQAEIVKINKVLDSNDWTYLGLNVPSYWMGKWSISSKGAVLFEFQTKEIIPNWAQDKDVIIYIK